MQAGVILGPIERSSGQKQPTPGGPITPVHDLNVPYEGPEEYETPTADMFFPPVTSSVLSGFMSSNFVDILLEIFLCVVLNCVDSVANTCSYTVACCYAIAG